MSDIGFFAVVKKKNKEAVLCFFLKRKKAVIVIQGGKTKLVNVKNQDTITKILDMVPDVVDRFTGKDERMTEKEVNDILDAEIEK